jgi:hypothetical protein
MADDLNLNHTKQQMNIPMLLFWFLFVILAILSFLKRYSAIPVLGMISNFYLMAQLNFTNWAAFLIWLLLGLVIYLSYGRYNSKLNTNQI